jgi:hypothetical protein
VIYSSRRRWRPGRPGTRGSIVLNHRCTGLHNISTTETVLGGLHPRSARSMSGSFTPKVAAEAGEEKGGKKASCLSAVSCWPLSCHHNNAKTHSFSGHHLGCGTRHPFSRIANRRNSADPNSGSVPKPARVFETKQRLTGSGRAQTCAHCAGAWARGWQ